MSGSLGRARGHRREWFISAENSLMSRSLSGLGGAALGAALGLIAAFVFGALIGLVFGAPWFTEPGPEVPPGLDGAAFGALVYGTLGCIPAVLLGAVVGGLVGANRAPGRNHTAESGGGV